MYLVYLPMYFYHPYKEDILCWIRIKTDSLNSIAQIHKSGGRRLLLTPHCGFWRGKVPSTPGTLPRSLIKKPKRARGRNGTNLSTGGGGLVQKGVDTRVVKEGQGSGFSGDLVI